MTSSPSPDPTRGPATPPSEAELRRIARPATVRRAPKFRAFIVVGALVGIVLGSIIGAVASVGLLQNQTPAIVMSAIGLGGFGALAAAGIAVWVDHRSSMRRPKA